MKLWVKDNYNIIINVQISNTNGRVKQNSDIREGEKKKKKEKKEKERKKKEIKGKIKKGNIWTKNKKKK